eukprot:SAG11_NODE_692_length_7698_cov_4.143308_7_plen_176_part_00
MDCVTGESEPFGQELSGHSSQIGGIAMAGATCAACASDGRLLVWRATGTWGSADSGQVRTHELQCADELRAVAITADGRRLLAGGDECIGRIWCLPAAGGGKLAEPWDLIGHQDWIMSVALSADGLVAATGSGDGTCMLWRLPAEGAAANIQPVMIGVLQAQVTCRRVACRRPIR